MFDPLTSGAHEPATLHEKYNVLFHVRTLQNHKTESNSCWTFKNQLHVLISPLIHNFILSILYLEQLSLDIIKWSWE